MVRGWRVNYGELKARLQGDIQTSYSHRDDIDATVLEDMIDQARERIGSLLRNRSVRTRGSLTVTNGAAGVPTGLQRIRSIQDADGNPLRPLSAEEYGKWEALGNAGSPAGYFAGTLQILFQPTNSGTYTIDYHRDPTAFSLDTDTVNQPALFIYATMAEIARYYEDDAREARYERAFATRMLETNNAQRLEQRAIGRSGYDYSRHSVGL